MSENVSAKDAAAYEMKDVTISDVGGTVDQKHTATFIDALKLISKIRSNRDSEIRANQ
jgi:CTP synthase (UTP-ammonia lyase)